MAKTGYGFRREGVQRIVRVVREWEGQPTDLTRGRGREGHSVDSSVEFKLTGRAAPGGLYNIKTVWGSVASGGVSVTASTLVLPGSMEAATEDNAYAFHTPEEGTTLHILPINDDVVYCGRPVGMSNEATPKPIYAFVAVPRGTIFGVKVTQTGGSQGTKTTTPSYTYTVKTLDAVVTLGTGVAQSRPRAKGRVDVQTNGPGLAYLNESGTLILFDAGEVPKGAGC